MALAEELKTSVEIEDSKAEPRACWQWKQAMFTYISGKS